MRVSVSGIERMAVSHSQDLRSQQRRTLDSPHKSVDEVTARGPSSSDARYQEMS